MDMDLTGITSVNEYYTNHYLASIFAENAAAVTGAWQAKGEGQTPWSRLRVNARSYYAAHDRYLRSHFDMQTLGSIRSLADEYLQSLGYPAAAPQRVPVTENVEAPVYLELTKPSGAPALWILLAASADKEEGVLEKQAFFSDTVSEISSGAVYRDQMTGIANEELVTKIFFSLGEPPRFILLIGMNQIALVDRNKWNEKRYLQFELNDIFSRREEAALQAMAVLLHRESLCPQEGGVLLDELDENSHRHASGVSQDLKYALRESIELLGNELLYDMARNRKRDLEAEPVDAAQLTLECLRYMYRMLFVLFIEARPELGYAPVKAQSYLSGYSLESLRNIADSIRDGLEEVGDGYYLHETLAKLYEMIYTGYPKTEAELLRYSAEESLHDMFVIAPLKAHIFDPEYTKMFHGAKLRNRVMLRIVELMSLTRPDGRRNSRRRRISYANLGINQMGAVYEALLSYRGFIAEQDLYEVKRKGDPFNELEVGYFIPESELNQYEEEERVRFEEGENKGRLRMYPKGTFIYRLAGREREKSASYYTPESLTRCLVKYALKELLEGKTAGEILQLTICEPAMGSAAFLNEAISQLAEAYLERKQKETGVLAAAQDRVRELQKIKMFIADRNVYGVDLNPVAVELAEVSLWLNTIYPGGLVPWFGAQLVNGNSLIGARRQVYAAGQLTATAKGLRWYECAPERLPFGRPRAKRGSRRQVYHFLLGDPGMACYSDKTVKERAPEAFRAMREWSRGFSKPYSEDELRTLLDLSSMVDKLWESQVKLRKVIREETQDALSIFGHEDAAAASHTSIRQKDWILSWLYKSEHMKNAGPYARLKFVMDYWCALWFWPVGKAELLPSRSEFFLDLRLILEGVLPTRKEGGSLDEGQSSLFAAEQNRLAAKVKGLLPGVSVVDLDGLCNLFPRLALVRELAEQRRFMHWELEFADLFAERGGFDLVIGNPPWIKIEWNEQSVLADRHPMFAVKKLTANQTVRHRDKALENAGTRALYFSEYESMAGQQSFLNAMQNYPELKGQQTNLFKCFLPQAWRFGNPAGISAFIHPDGVYDDPKGDALRELLYPRLRRHYQFVNEKLLFAEVGHPTVFSLNIFGAPRSLKEERFHSISNLFDPASVDQCYEAPQGEAEGIKNAAGEWSVKGHPDRVLYYGESELAVLASLSGGEAKPLCAKLLALQTQQLLATIARFAAYGRPLRSVKPVLSEMWHETYAQNDGTIARRTQFPLQCTGMICSGPHIAVGNPLFKTPRRRCEEKGDYDCIDLTCIGGDYLPRSNYEICVSNAEYWARNADVNGKKYHMLPKLVSRKMLNLKQERTFNVAMLPEGYGHINGLVGIVFQDERDYYICGASWASVPVDFYVKVMGKSNFNFAAGAGLPVLRSQYDGEIIARGLLLNALTAYYANVYQRGRLYAAEELEWSRDDPRLKQAVLPDTWDETIPLRTDFARRQALVEIDVLTAMALGMDLEQLKMIYKLQFAVAQQYESDTWYDANGRIVFTTNRSLTGVGLTRSEWESGVKGAPAGQKFYRTIDDDTVPGGPVRRTIEYAAPFDRCDRVRDYEAAWKFFEEKYRKE